MEYTIVNQFSLTYELVGTGWARATLTLDGADTVVTASYISDALGDLIDATSVALRLRPLSSGLDKPCLRRELCESGVAERVEGLLGGDRAATAGAHLLDDVDDNVGVVAEVVVRMSAYGRSGVSDREPGLVGGDDHVSVRSGCCGTVFVVFRVWSGAGGEEVFVG